MTRAPRVRLKLAPPPQTIGRRSDSLAKIATYKKQISELQGEVTELKTKVRRRLSNDSVAEVGRAEWQRQVDLAAASRSKYKELQRVKAEADSKEESIKEEMDTCVADLKSQLESYQSSTGKLEKQLATASAALTRCEGALSKSKTRVEGLIVSRAAANMKRGVELQKWKDRSLSYKEKLGEVNELTATLKAHVASLKRKLTAATNRADTAEVKRLQAIANADEWCSAERTKFSKLKDDMEGQLTTTRRESERRVAAAVEESERLAAAAIAKELELDRQRARFEGVIHACEEAKKAEMGRLEEAFNLAQQNIETLENEMAGLSESVIPAAPHFHTEEEYAALAPGAQYTARSRQIQFAEWFLNRFEWRAADLATVIGRRGEQFLDDFFDTKELWRLRMEWLREVIGICENTHWRVKLGLYCTLSEHMPSRQLRRIAYAASFDYDVLSNNYRRRVLVTNPHKQSDIAVVPRILPPPCAFADDLKQLASSCDLTVSADGRIACQSLELLSTKLIHETCRTLNVDLSYFSEGGENTCYGNIQLDAARRRTRQFVVVALKNPQLLSESCFALHLLALGVRFKDDRNGAQRLLEPNLPLVEQLLIDKHIDVPVKENEVDGQKMRVKFELRFTGDFAGVRGIEGQLCSCGPEAIHLVPTEQNLAGPASDVMAWLGSMCDTRATADARARRSHWPAKGSRRPSPCDCCNFGHSRNPEVEFDELETTWNELDARAQKNDAGKRELQNKQKVHRKAHRNTALGPNGRPLTSATLFQWVLDFLHVDLNEGKGTWKWGLIRLLPAAVRSDMSDYLKTHGLPLDLRTKEEGRVAQDKFYDDCEWNRFIEGGGKSEGGPVMIAALVKKVADYYEGLAVAYRAAAAEKRQEAEASAAAKAKPSKGSSKPAKNASRGGVVQYSGSASTSAVTPSAEATEIEEPPWMADVRAARKAGRSEAERLADQPSLVKIRNKYGEMGERLIAMLLTFDSHFAFRRVMRKRFDSRDVALRAEHALAFARSHRCWFEQFERVSHGQHRSVYPHRTQFTGPQQIYELGDLWCYSLGALESHHAEVRSAFYLYFLLRTTLLIPPL